MRTTDYDSHRLAEQNQQRRLDMESLSWQARARSAADTDLDFYEQRYPGITAEIAQTTNQTTNANNTP